MTGVQGEAALLSPSTHGHLSGSHMAGSSGFLSFSHDASSLTNKRSRDLLSLGLSHFLSKKLPVVHSEGGIKALRASPNELLKADMSLGTAAEWLQCTLYGRVVLESGACGFSWT